MSPSGRPGREAGRTNPGRTSPWTVSPAVRGTAIAAIAVLLGGLALGRADLVVLAGPVLLAMLLATAGGRPASHPRAVVSVPALLAEGRPTRVAVEVSGLAGAQFVVVRVPSRQGEPQGVVRVAGVGGGRTSVRIELAGLRWGQRTIACPDLLAVGPDGAFLAGPVAGEQTSVLVLPGVAEVGAVPLPPRAGGLVGMHRTRRPGDGSELLDVREFAPGDRLRRVDWRVTARHGTRPLGAPSSASANGGGRGDGGGAGGTRVERLYVRRTAVDSDADLVLCVDSRVDLGPVVGAWADPERFVSPPGTGAAHPGGTLDTAVRAASGLAAGQLRAGDRVALVDLGRFAGGVRAGTGRRHLHRLRLTLARARVNPQAQFLRLHPGVVRPGATVVVLSPFIDDAVTSFTTALRRRGDRVIAIDTLPRPLELLGLAPADREALTLVLTERRWRLARLAADGIPVLAWDPQAVRTALARMRRPVGRARR